MRYSVVDVQKNLDNRPFQNWQKLQCRDNQSITSDCLENDPPDNVILDRRYCHRMDRAECLIRKVANINIWVLAKIQQAWMDRFLHHLQDEANCKACNF